MIRQDHVSSLQTEEAEIQGRRYLRLFGRLDIHTSPRLFSAANAILQDGADQLNLDMSEVQFMDSSGIGSLVKINESLRSRGKHLLLKWVPPNIYEILTSAKLHKVLEIEQDRRKAPRGEISLTREKLLGNLHPCWEMFGCEAHECSYFGGQHYVCWTLPHAPCKSIISEDILEEIAGCTRCVVFQNNVQFLGEIHSHYSRYISEAEESFRRLRDRSISLETAVAARTKELALSEASFRDLFEEANDTLFDLEGRSGVFKSINLEFERQTGLPREAWIGRSFFDIVDSRDKSRAMEQYRRASHGEKVSLELRLDLAPEECQIVWCSFRPAPGIEHATRVRGSWSDVTELVRVREEHARLYQATQEISDYVMIVDQRSHIVFANRAFCQAWGYASEEEVIGLHADAVQTGLPKDYCQTLLREVSNKGMWQGEVTATRRDGTSFPIEIYASPIFNDEQSAHLLVLVSRDISARKQVESMLRESRQKYARLVEGAADAMVVFGEDGTIQQANRQACEFLGLTQTQIQGISLSDLWSNGSEKALTKEMSTLKQTGRFFGHAVFRHSSGCDLEAEINATNLGDGLCLGIIRDIADRRRIETENRVVREQFETLFRSIIDGVMLVDESGQVSIYNKQFREVLGLRSEDLDTASAQSFYDMVAERSEDPRDFRKWAHSISIEPNSVARRELVLLRPEKRTIRIYTGPVRSTQESIVGRVWMLRDVTEQRRLEEQLVQSQKMESIGTLAGGIAHDFNNLLTSILGYSSILLRSIPPTHPHYRPVRSIDSSAQRAAELTQGLLAFSRRRETKMRPIRLNDVVRDTMRLLGRMIPKQIEMINELAPNLPSVKGDAMQLEQVIMNLCVNARDAMRDGGTLTIRTSTKEIDIEECPSGIEAPCGKFVVLSIEDTGSGIPEEMRERIFEPFFTTKAAGEGTGLGLALAYGIMRSHGGFINVDSIMGQGSRFDLYFPPTVLELESPRKTSMDTTAPPGHGECILLVDDEPVVREVAETVLQQLGYRVITAPGGPEALEIYRKQAGSIDLVLLDLMMPKMRGEKVFAHLREINPNVRVIISTGNPEMIDRFPELLAYATGFANKPYRMADLSKALNAALKKQV